MSGSSIHSVRGFVWTDCNAFQIDKFTSHVSGHNEWVVARFNKQ